jgi:hypothetical protein
MACKNLIANLIGHRGGKIIGRSSGERLRNPERRDNDTPNPTLSATRGKISPSHAACPRSYQPRERRTMCTTDNITGTFTSTPTTVEKRRARLEAEQRDCCRNGQLRRSC